MQPKVCYTKEIPFRRIEQNMELNIPFRRIEEIPFRRIEIPFRYLNTTEVYEENAGYKIEQRNCMSRVWDHVLGHFWTIFVEHDEPKYFRCAHEVRRVRVRPLDTTKI